MHHEDTMANMDTEYDNLELLSATFNHELEISSEKGENYNHPSQSDMLWNAAQPIIDRHNNQSFIHFSSPIEGRVPESRAANTTGDPAFYVLQRNSRIASVKLRLISPRDGSQLITDIEVQDGGEWIGLQAWLERFPLVDVRHFSGDEGFELQYLWWKATGRPFRLVDLHEDCLRPMLLHLFGEHVKFPGEYYAIVTFSFKGDVPPHIYEPPTGKDHPSHQHQRFIHF